MSFFQSTTDPLKIIVGWIWESLGSNWIRFGSSPLQYKKKIGAHSICKASDAEHVQILVGSVLAGMVFDLILVGRAMDD